MSDKKPSRLSIIGTLAFWGVVAFIGYGVYQNWPTEEEIAARDAAYAAAKAAETATKEEAERKEAEACRDDLECFIKPVKVEAQAQCQVAVQELARFDYEWESFFKEPTFDHVAWVDKEKGTVRFSGKRVKFQNGSGAWQRHRYFCKYNVTEKLFLGAEAQPPS